MKYGIRLDLVIQAELTVDANSEQEAEQKILNMFNQKGVPAFLDHATGEELGFGLGGRYEKA